MATPTPIHPTQRHAAAFEAVLRRTVLRPLFRNFRAGLSTAAGAAELIRRLDNLAFDPRIRAGLVDGEVRAFYQRMQQWHRKRLITTFRSALAVDIRGVLNDPPVHAWMSRKIKENVDLILTIPASAHHGLATRLERNLRTRPFDEKLTSDMLRQQYGATGYQLRRLARDQTSKAVGQLTQIRHEQAGISEYIWRTVQDGRVRPTHVHFEGKRFSWSRGSPEGHPGEPIQCFPGSARILPAGLEASIAYRYVGKLIEVTLANGVHVTATPNHPVLTEAGWKRAGDVQEGDKLLQHSGAGGLSRSTIDPEVDDRYTTAEELHRLLQGNMPHYGAHRRSVDLYGRPARGDEQVDVVPVPSHLRDRFDALGAEVFQDIGLEHSNAVRRGLHSFRLSPSGEVATPKVPGGAMSFFGEPLPLLRAQSSHADTVGLATATALQTEIVHAGVHHRAVDTEVLGYGENGRPGLVESKHLRVVLNTPVVRAELIARYERNAEVTQARVRHLASDPQLGRYLYSVLSSVRESLDGGMVRNTPFEVTRVTGVRAVDYDGTVYDFSTHSGLIIADTALVSNCRCAAEPVIALRARPGDPIRPAPGGTRPAPTPSPVNRPAPAPPATPAPPGAPPGQPSAAIGANAPRGTYEGSPWAHIERHSEVITPGGQQGIVETIWRKDGVTARVRLDDGRKVLFNKALLTNDYTRTVTRRSRVILPDGREGKVETVWLKDPRMVGVRVDGKRVAISRDQLNLVPGQDPKPYPGKIKSGPKPKPPPRKRTTPPPRKKAPPKKRTPAPEPPVMVGDFVELPDGTRGTVEWAGATHVGIRKVTGEYVSPIPRAGLKNLTAQTPAKGPRLMVETTADTLTEEQAEDVRQLILRKAADYDTRIVRLSGRYDDAVEEATRLFERAAKAEVQFSVYDEAMDKARAIRSQILDVRVQRSQELRKALRFRSEQRRPIPWTVDWISGLHAGTPNGKAVTRRIQAALKEFEQMTGRDWTNHPITFQVGRYSRGNNIRESAGHRSHGTVIYMNDKTTVKTIVHEMGHAFENSDINTLSRAVEHIHSRTAGEPLRRLRDITGSKSYRASETAREDEFFSPYIGKEYTSTSPVASWKVDNPWGGKPITTTELVSMGAEHLYDDPLQLAVRDPKTFRFILREMRRRRVTPPRSAPAPLRPRPAFEVDPEAFGNERYNDLVTKWASGSGPREYIPEDKLRSGTKRYLADDYERVNRKMREIYAGELDDLPDYEYNIMEDLRADSVKLRSATTVYRGLPDDLDLSVGSKIDLAQPTSTSLTANVPIWSFGGRNTLMEIKVKKGTRAIVTNESELEYILMPGAKARVVGRLDNVELPDGTKIKRYYQIEVE